jgi:hypothetical protein
MSFAGTVPSTSQLYFHSLIACVLKKSLTKILLVTENSPPPLYISSLHLSSVQSQIPAPNSLPLCDRHFICQDPKPWIPNAHNSQLISNTSFITRTCIYLSSAPIGIVDDSPLEQGPLFDHKS